MRIALFCAFLVSVCLQVVEVSAENWPGWRGPRFDGVSTETNLPTEWSASKNVAWRVKLPGMAGSSPVVWGDRVFLTSVDKNDLVLICVGTDGKQLWKRKVSEGDRMIRNDEGNYASPSPSTDGKHVWTFMGDGSLACYTVEGEKVWAFNVQERYGKLSIAFGMSSTPVLHAGRLFVQLIHGEGKPETQEAMVVALDAATGSEIWAHPRVTKASRENEHSYASPILYQDKQQSYLLTHGGDYTIAHALSDGKEIWRIYMNREDEYHPTLRFVASPGVAPGIIVSPSAKRLKVSAIRPDLKGDLTKNSDATVWSLPKSTPDVPSPIIHDGLVYLCSENGNLTCVDAKTGEEYYLERTHRLRHRASPVYADGKIYLTARDGKVTVVKAGKSFEILAQNDTGQTQTSSLAISGGTIYLRTWEELWAIRK